MKQLSNFQLMAILWGFAIFLTTLVLVLMILRGPALTP